MTPLLRDRGVETLLLLPEEPGPAADMLRARGVDVVQQPLHRLRASGNPLLHARFVWHFIGEVFRIRRLIRDRRIDVVLVNGSINPHGAIAARLAGVPVIWQLLDTRPPRWMLHGSMWLIRGLAAVVMTTGMAVARRHPGAEGFGNRLVSFFPPVDTQLFRPDAEARQSARRRLNVSDDAVLVGTVGNLTAQKGHEYFIRALAELLPDHPDLQARIIGCEVDTHQDYADSLRREADDAGLTAGGRFAFVAPEAGIESYLPAFDIFVLSSVPRSEGIPTSVLEAMSCGVPVVAADVGSVAEAVADGVTGRIFPACDVAALAAQVSNLAANPERRQAMGQAARERALAEFDAARCADVHKHAIDLALRRGIASDVSG